MTMKRYPTPLVILGVAAIAVVTVGGAVTLAASRRDDRSDVKERVKIVHADDDDDDAGRRAYLGVRVERDDSGRARVAEVLEDSPAERAGIERGDVIVDFDGNDVARPRDLVKSLHDAEPGREAQVEVLRDGKRQTFDVELGEPPEGWARLPFHPGEHRRRFFAMGHPPKLGVQLVQVTPELREHLGGSREAGVLVGKVLPGMPAEEAGLEVGDLIVSVDGATIDSAGDLIEALGDKDGRSISIEVVRDGRRKTFDATLPEKKKDDEESSGPRASWSENGELRALIRGAQETARDAARLARTEAARAIRESSVEARRAAGEARRAAQQLRRHARREARRAYARWVI